MSKVKHHNVVGIYGFGVYQANPYIVMEYLEGISLADLLQQEHRLSKEEAIPIFAQVCDALSAAHEKGIVHRDIKPSNIMLIGPRRTAKIIDFGIAKFMSNSGTDNQNLTQANDTVGTVSYMSPEQCLGGVLDQRSDIYSLACVIFESLSGALPHSGKNAVAIMHKHITAAPIVADYMGDELGKVVLSALEKEPGRRPQTTATFKDALLNPDAYVFSAGWFRPNPISALALAILMVLSMLTIKATEIHPAEAAGYCVSSKEDQIVEPEGIQLIDRACLDHRNTHDRRLLSCIGH